MRASEELTYPVKTPRASRWPVYADDEIEAVTRILESGKVNYWTGEECRQFERDYAESLEQSYAVAVANGTVALELALMAAGIQPGDEVVVTPRTFIASASAAVRQGGRVVFADVDRDTQNITAETISQVLTERTRFIIAVHLAGHPCDMDPILELARIHNLIVIEDCAQAHGATYKGRPVGSFGDISAFSFCQDKIISTGGEGGMVVTNSERYWRTIWSAKDHGKSWTAVNTPSNGETYRWLHEDFGTNLRMTEMQAAIGRIQLRKLPNWSAQRRKNAQTLFESIKGMKGIRLPAPDKSVAHAFYKAYAFVEADTLAPGWSRDRILTTLHAFGVNCSVGSCSEIYLEKAFTSRGIHPASRLLVARELGETSLMFPVDPTLDENDMGLVAERIREVMSQAVSSAHK